VGSRARCSPFPSGGGLSVTTSGVVPADTYTIVVLFRLADLGDQNTYRRIADFKAGTSDNGVYFRGSALAFYTTTDGAVAIGGATADQNKYVQVVLRQSPDNQFAGYLNVDHDAQGDACDSDYSGGPGRDTIRARNSKKETVNCGGGRRDTAIVDRNEKVKRCERVGRPS
jgi:hypothetical protein